MRATTSTLTFVLLLIAASSPSVNATLSAAELDAKASTINFVGHKPDGKHEGGFKEFTADAKLPTDNLSEGSLVIEIDATSLWSDDPRLTNHLKNPDFFDVRKHPRIKFESTSMTTNASHNEGVVTGELTMLGKTNQVKVPIAYSVEKGIRTVKADFKIDRTKWGMNYGDGKIDKQVDIEASLVFKP